MCRCSPRHNVGLVKDLVKDTDNAGGARAGSLPERLARVADEWGWRRTVLARRVAAGLLVLAAVVLAIRAPTGAQQTVAVVVAAHDLPSGATVRPGDVEVRRWPAELLPAGALRALTEVEGRVLAGAANLGEPFTAVRLATPELAGGATGARDAASVPIRLADADVAALLSPGRLVDVVTLGQHADQPTVLAAGAVVLTVLPADVRSGGRGRLVLVAVPRAAASKLAAATLSQEVTVTLR
jgi:Flp pilus assembly protein CpaB